mmetsp:Transcript_98044/g.253552  ORF Transcript_98044/g.253552 Transcript_98044/m.253552 type:complete len:208 (-) Transcript_98044:628-1251(-)
MGGALPRGAGRTERDCRSGAMWQREPRGGKRGTRAGGLTSWSASEARAAVGRQAQHGLRRANHLCGRRQCSHRRCRGSKPSAAPCRLWYQRGPAGRLSQGAGSTADHGSDGGGEARESHGRPNAAEVGCTCNASRADRHAGPPAESVLPRPRRCIPACLCHRRLGAGAAFHGIHGQRARAALAADTSDHDWARLSHRLRARQLELRR